MKSLQSRLMSPGSWAVMWYLLGEVLSLTLKVNAQARNQNCWKDNTMSESDMEGQVL